ncbi:hypothetical protein [Tunturiibacter lichenicola]|uniref:hypothetical protein n=1 Tax=Tunturiibacter lichenicola TaxID=2051959 RepID=UPI003D9ADB15
MKGMSSGVLSMAVMLAAGAAAAQGVPSAPIDLAVTYDGLHINHIAAQNLGAALHVGDVQPQVCALRQGVGPVPRMQ